MINDSLGIETFQLLDNVPIGLCVIDHEYTVKYWNHCLENWSRKDKSVVHGKKLYELYPQFAEPLYKARIDTILEGGAPTIFSSQLHGYLFNLKLPNGKNRILQTTITKIRVSNIENFYALITIQDLSELSNRINDYREMKERAEEEADQRKVVAFKLKDANEKILKQQKSLIEEERLKVLLQMAGATAHELNQPLMILLGHIQLLQMDIDNPEALLKHINKIEETGERISSVVKKIQKVKYISRKPYVNNDEIIDINQQERMLHIEDDNVCFKLIKSMLSKIGFSQIEQAETIEKGKEFVRNGKIDLVILDHQLPDGDALEFLNFLKSEQYKIPVIILTGAGDEVLASQLIRHGAYDYLTKNHLSMDLLDEAIKIALGKHYFQRDKERAMHQMVQMSIKDELTNLYNRRYFNEAFSREFLNSKRNDKEFSVCIIDIDFFKEVNDMHGHNVGDQILQSISKIIQSNTREYDISCRYGGDEFSILFPDTHQDGTFMVCERIRKGVENNIFSYDEIEIKVTCSIGLASSKNLDLNSKNSQKQLIEMADNALYEAKNSGRNRLVVGTTLGL